MDCDVVDLHLVLIEDVVVFLHLPGERVVAVHKGTHRSGDGGLGVAGHRKEALFEPVHFFGVMGHG